MFVSLPTNCILFNSSTGGGSMFGDVNISAILDSFSVSYDKRVRPNYGGKCQTGRFTVCKASSFDQKPIQSCHLQKKNCKHSHYDYKHNHEIIKCL